MPPNSVRGWCKYVHNHSKMAADGRHFEKKTIEKSLYVSNVLTDQREILHNDAY